MNIITNNCQQIKNFITSKETSILLNRYVDDISQVVDSYLEEENEKSNVKVLQASIIAIYDVHNKLYNNSSIFLTNNYDKDSNALALYKNLTDSDINNNDSSKLNQICKHTIANPIKQIINTYTPFKTQFTEHSLKLIDKIMEKTFKNGFYNLVKDTNMLDLRSILSRLLKDLKSENKNIDKNFSNTEYDAISTIKQMETYFNLPIITSDDIKYFLPTLLSIANILKLNFKNCINSLNHILNLNSGFIETAKNALKTNINKIIIIGNELVELIQNMKEMVGIEEKDKFDFSYIIDINDSEEAQYIIFNNEEIASTNPFEKINEKEYIIFNNEETESTNPFANLLNF